MTDATRATTEAVTRLREIIRWYERDATATAPKPGEVSALIEALSTPSSGEAQPAVGVEDVARAERALEALRSVAGLERSTDRTDSVMIANWIVQDLALIRPQATGEAVAWLIERENCPTPVWWNAPHGWSADSNAAMHFCRKSDAEALLDFHSLSGIAFASEHVFTGPAHPFTGEGDVAELVEALRQWSCGSCGGSGQYLNRSVERGEETVTCKVCEGHGQNPIARAALAKHAAKAGAGS